jgi:hypothetical protein
MDVRLDVQWMEQGQRGKSGGMSLLMPVRLFTFLGFLSMALFSMFFLFNGSATRELYDPFH